MPELSTFPVTWSEYILKGAWYCLLARRVARRWLFYDSSRFKNWGLRITLSWHRTIADDTQCCKYWLLTLGTTLGSSCRHLPEEPNLSAVSPENFVLENFSSTTTYSFVHHTHVFVDDVSHSFVTLHLFWRRIHFECVDSLSHVFRFSACTACSCMRASTSGVEYVFVL